MCQRGSSKSLYEIKCCGLLKRFILTKLLNPMLERKWLRAKLTIDEQNFKDQRNTFNALLRYIRSKQLCFLMFRDFEYPF